MRFCILPQTTSNTNRKSHMKYKIKMMKIKLNICAIICQYALLLKNIYYSLKILNNLTILNYIKSIKMNYIGFLFRIGIYNINNDSLMAMI